MVDRHLILKNTYLSLVYEGHLHKMPCLPFVFVSYVSSSRIVVLCKVFKKFNNRLTYNNSYAATYTCNDNNYVHA